MAGGTHLLRALAVCALAAAAAAQELPARHVIPEIPPLPGPDPLVKAIGRAVRVAADPALSDDYLFGVTGGAFLATVCSNNCNCRDYRELSLSVDPALDALGLRVERFDGTDDATWLRVKASLADGVPVVAWNPFGDFEDALLTGYDEGNDLLYGWSPGTEGEDYAQAPLSKWRAAGMSGYLFGRGLRDGVDRRAVQASRLAVAVRMAHRPPIEGG